MAKTTIIVELDLPPAFFFLRHAWAIYNLVADNLNVIGVRADQMHENAADDGGHARRKHNDWNVVFSRPLVKIIEVWVQRDVFAKSFDALREGSFDAFGHLLEQITAAVIKNALSQAHSAQIYTHPYRKVMRSSSTSILP